MQYLAQKVELDDLANAVQTFMAQGGKGCNITVPFKFEAAALAHESSERVQLAQAANTLRFEQGRILADNTDGVGLVSDITLNAGHALQDQDVLLLGAGGAAAGVLGPLILARPRRLVVSNRTHDKAVQLVAHHQQLAQTHGVQLTAHALDQVPGSFHILINATASSLCGAALNLPNHWLQAHALVYDMMYGPAAQPFLNWAQQAGAHGRDGLGMLVEQAAYAFELWRGVRPPAAQVLSELREHLA